MPDLPYALCALCALGSFHGRHPRTEQTLHHVAEGPRRPYGEHMTMLPSVVQPGPRQLVFAITAPSWRKPSHSSNAGAAQAAGE